jgi:hypothetical protein
MSGSQVVLVIVVVAAFALGWWGHGWRQRDRSTAEAGRAVGDPPPPTIELAPPTPDPPPLPELDAALRDLLTAFQAALVLWQAQGTRSHAPTPATAQAMTAFRRHRSDLAALDLGSDASPASRPPLRRALRAADRLAEGLAPLASGVPLEREHERALIGAERALSAARYELLGSAQTPRSPGGPTSS